MRKRPGGWADTVHHIASFTGRGPIICGAGDANDFEIEEKSIDLADVTCKECLAHWQKAFDEATDREERARHFHDGPMVV